MSKSVQEMVDKINQKISSDKNIIQKEKNTDDFNNKMAKILSNSKANDKKGLSYSCKNMDPKNENEIINRQKREATILNVIMTDKVKNKGKEKINNNNNNPNIKPKNETNNKLEQNMMKIVQNEIIEKNIRKISSIKTESDKEKESMAKLEVLDDAYNFNEEEFKKRRYDKNNVEKSGKKFFKLRYLKNKLDPKNTKEEKNDDSQLVFDKERILRKYNSEFILTVEKSILSFNVKNFKDSYEVLKNSEIIKNVKEYGEFLLVVSGFDKFLIGEFLAKQKYPNDKKEVLNNFIESINMKSPEISFLDCLRFLFTRLNLPKDANLILEIMDKFSVNFFDVNKKDQKFVETYISSDKVYLLVSTILALNTMFTRKDIKIKNVIKKDEFIKMNADLSKDFLGELYDELKKNPISITMDDYNELMYKKLASLAEESNNDKTEEKVPKAKTFILSNKNSNINAEDKTNDNSNIINKTGEKTNNNLIEQFIELDDEDLNNMKEEDKAILKTPQKLYRINKGKKSELREYVFTDNFSRLYYLKKPKKLIDISKLLEIYNGSEHSHNIEISKYLKNNPSDEQFSSNFVSLIFEDGQFDFMSDNLDSVLKWYKAIKNLMALNRSKKNRFKHENKVKQFENEIKQLTSDIWEAIINKWNIYGAYIIIKLMERNKLIFNITKDIYQIDNSKKLSYKSIHNFLKSIEQKISKDKEIEYSDFINLYYVGLPDFTRKGIWKILIGNPCGILPTTYDQIKKKIPKILFNNLDLNNPEGKKYSTDALSDKIIKEIIEVNPLFIFDEANNDMDKKDVMEKIYNVTRSFWSFRQDIPYNKSLINIAYLFLFVFREEDEIFINLVNVICTNILPIFVGIDNEIKNYSNFFNYLLDNYLKKIHKQFQKMEITPELYMIPWFEELFTKTFNLNMLYHIFDLFLLNGEYILFQTSLSIIKSLEDDLPNLTINEILKTLQRFPENISETFFMYTMYNFDGIKKEVSGWKSQNDIANQKSNLFSIYNSK